MKVFVSRACALALAALSLSAFAGETQGHQGFVRGEIGNARMHIDGMGSENDTSYGIGGGYWFNGNWGVEGQYDSLFDKNFSIASVKLQTLSLGAVAKKNFGADGNGFYIGGRAGYSLSEARTRCNKCVYAYSNTEDSSGGYAGVNVGYDFTRNVGLGLTYTHYRAFSNADVNNLTVSAEYRF